jgi:hypothetical protein
MKTEYGCIMSVWCSGRGGFALKNIFSIYFELFNAVTLLVGNPLAGDAATFFVGNPLAGVGHPVTRTYKWQVWRACK